MKIAVFLALGLLLYGFIVVWLTTHLRYQIRSRYLKFSIFGIRLRRIPFERIHYVTKRRPEGLCEFWWSTIRPGHRTLFIRLRSGLRRNVAVTPRNRYVFRADLERAMRKAGVKTDEPLSGVMETDTVVPGE